MRALILDDNDDKRSALRQALIELSPDDGIDLVEATCVITGLDALRAESFDLLILDLVLPMRKDQLASAYGGKAVLDEILDGSLHIPSHIVCVTAHEEESGILSEDVQRNLVHIVPYNELTDDWKQRLQAKAKLIMKRLAQSSNDVRQHSSDIVIVTSSPLIELKEVNRLPGGFVAEFDQNDQIHYYHAEWIGGDGRTKSVISCAAPTMGMTAACVTACKAIERWRPRFVVMTGIAASTVADQSFGDVLCVESAYDYGSGKIQDDEHGERRFVPSPQHQNLDPKIQAIVKHCEREQLGMDEIGRIWRETHQEATRSPRLLVGVIASGAAVVQSSEMVEQVKSVSRKTVGLDMEAYAIFQACALSSAPRPIAFVAKGISDFADSSKGDHAQQIAAFNSARFVYHFFTTHSEVWG